MHFTPTTVSSPTPPDTSPDTVPLYETTGLAGNPKIARARYIQGRRLRRNRGAIYAERSILHASFLSQEHY